MTRARRPRPLWLLGLLVLSAPACFQRGKKRAPPPDAGAVSASPNTLDAGSSASAALPPLPPAPEQGPPRPGGEATLYLEVEPAHLNPLLADGIVARRTGHNLDEALLRQDPVTGAIEPCLADSFTLSPDGRTLELTLRDGVRWHDGRPLTLRDVVFTLKLAARKDGPAAAWAADLEGLTLTELGPRRLRLGFARAQFSRLASLAHLMILPAHVFARGDFTAHPAARAPVGTGPFELASWSAGRIRLERNSRYWGRAPWLDAVTYRVVADRAQAVELARAGELDLIWHLPADDAAALVDDSAVQSGALRLQRYAPPQLLAVVWNCRRPALASAAVRQALDRAIDRRGVVAALAGRAWPIAGPFLPGTPAWTPPPAVDAAAARALLADAGVPGTITLLTPAGSRTAPPVAALLRDDLAQVGVTLALREVPWGDLLAALAARDFDAALLVEQSGLEPDLYPMLHGSQSAAGDNRGGCSSPAVDATLEAIRAEADPDRRLALERTLVGQLATLVPLSYLAVDARTALIARRLAGARPTLEWFWPRDMWIAP
ncbi:MAG: hypothetical protein IT370_10465 [Deltaproteobacteria bacterium]|nr:hypothetical protein [Deltaproteobacteria bacterium]